MDQNKYKNIIGISIIGEVLKTKSDKLAEKLRPFLDEWPISKNNYFMLLNENGDNLFIQLNDPSDFEIYFYKSWPGDYLISAGSNKDEAAGLEIMKTLIGFFDQAQIVYKIEASIDLKNKSTDELVFTHPDFKYD
ncbi:MAG: hypothetical protein ACI85U_003804 [Candidatus Promineifilaceae bacterium]|jgi:hypothetical protein